MATDTRIATPLSHLRGLRGAARGLSFLPRQPASSVLNGRHASRLRGRGLNFEEMRNYLPGDDIRSIDWKATARTGSPHVRVFTEERDRPALLVVDQSMSMFFGSVLNMKSVTAAEAAAIAAFRILDAGDRVGGIVFNDEELDEFVPKRSQRSVHALLGAISRRNSQLHADWQVPPTPARINSVLQRVQRIAHHDHLIIMLSDFAGIDDQTHRHLSAISRHNDLILGLVHDPAALASDARGRQVFSDGQMQVEINLDRAGIRRSVGETSQQRLEQIYAWQRKIQLSVLPLSAGEETLPQLRRLMAARQHRRRLR